jgi:predicted outer membrane repeat protein
LIKQNNEKYCIAPGGIMSQASGNKRIVCPLYPIILLLNLIVVEVGYAEVFQVTHSSDDTDLTADDGKCLTRLNLCTLRAAVMQANSLPGKDIVKLPADTYFLTLGDSGEDSALGGDLDVTDDLQVSGSGKADTIINGSAGDRLFHVMTDVALAVDNLTLTNGNAEFESGGGILNDGNLTLENVNITDCSAAAGGGIFNNESGWLSVAQGYLESNSTSASSGGGIENVGTAFINDTVFIKNTADGDGGGLASGYFRAKAPLSLTVLKSTRFLQNSARSGGAIYANGGYLISIGSDIRENSAYFGGGIYMSHSVTAYFQDAIIELNQAQYSSGGAAVSAAFLSVPDVHFNNTRIMNNTAEIGGGLRGGPFTFERGVISGNTATEAGGGAYTYWPVVISNSLIWNNTAPDGGGIYAGSGDFTLTNTTVSANQASNGDGGGIYNHNSRVELVNCTLADNQAGGLGGNIYDVADAGTVNPKFFHVTNSLIVDAQLGDNCVGAVVSKGNNIDTDGTCSLESAGDQPNVAAKSVIAPLLNNGGPAPTHALAENSPAFNAANPDVCPDIDQRQYYRDKGNNGCDVGAFDSEAVPAEPGELRFELPAYEGYEDEGVLPISVLRVGGTTGYVNVRYRTEDGSARGGMESTFDYTTVSGLLEWSDGDGSAKYIDVPVYNNNRFEQNRNFYVRLYQATNGAAVNALQAVEATIVDDDNLPGIFQFNQSALNTVENPAQQVNLTVRRENDAHQESVEFTVTGGSATRGVDYTLADGTLTFSPGEILANVWLTVLDDDEVEGDETIEVSLRNPTGGSSIGAIAAIVVTIAGDAPKPVVQPGFIQFASTGYKTVEGNPVVSIEVERLSGADGSVSAVVGVGGGSAEINNDFQLPQEPNHTIVFDSGVVTQSFQVTIVDDTAVETDETFSLILSDPTNGAAIGSKATTEILIADNDIASPGAHGRIQLAKDVDTSVEGEQYIFEIQRLDGTNGDVGVNYAITGDAQLNTDFTSSLPLTGTITLRNGETSQHIAINLTEDGIADPGESITITLSNSTGGATLGFPISQTLTINENETQTKDESDGTNGQPANEPSTNEYDGGGVVDLSTLFILFIVLGLARNQLFSCVVKRKI